MIDKMELSNKASTVRKMLGEDESSPIDIFSLVQTIEKLTLVVYPLGDNISGACIRNRLSSLIVVNSDMSLGRQRFSLAHELYHYYFDQDSDSIICAKKIGKGNEKERSADQFASYFLVPSAALYAATRKYEKSPTDKLSLNDIIRLEQYFGISHQAMLIRLQDESELMPTDVASMQGGISSAAARLGFDTSLYKPTEDGKKMKVLGHYICQAENLLDKDMISQGKYEELLLDAFRDDIVYGLESEEGIIVD